MQKLGSESTPLKISGETSSASRVLLGRVKPVWDGTQGDRGELGIDKVGTPIDWVLLVGFAPSNGSVVETLLQLRVGYVAFDVTYPNFVK